MTPMSSKEWESKLDNARYREYSRIDGRTCAKGLLTVSDADGRWFGAAMFTLLSFFKLKK